MKSLRIKDFIKRLYPLISVAIFILFWWFLSLIVGIEMIIPSPKAVLLGLFRLMATGEFWVAAANTTLRAVISFAVSFILALVLSIAGYFWRFVNKIMSPLVGIVRSTPTMSVILIAIIWFKSNISPIIITSLILFPLLYAAIYGALTAIPQGYKSLCDVYEIPYKTRITKLYIPYILPSVFVSAQSTISLGVKVMIASEVLAQTAKSMGNFMQLSRIYLDTPTLLAWTIAAIIVSFLLEMVVFCTKKGVVKWQR